MALSFAAGYAIDLGYYALGGLLVVLAAGLVATLPVKGTKP
jgi:hypothetical protein